MLIVDRSFFFCSTQLYDIAKGVLAPKLIARYDELLVLAASGRKDLMRHCGRCNVLFVGCPKSRKDPRTRCPNCGKCPFVPDVVAERRFRRWRVTNRHQQCHNCGTVVQKSSGCVHMVCRCGSHFCYRCGARDGENHSIACTSRNVLNECIDNVDSFVWYVKQCLSCRR